MTRGRELDYVPENFPRVRSVSRRELIEAVDLKDPISVAMKGLAFFPDIVGILYREGETYSGIDAVVAGATEERLRYISQFGTGNAQLGLDRVDNRRRGLCGTAWHLEEDVETTMRLIHERSIYTKPFGLHFKQAVSISPDTI